MFYLGRGPWHAWQVRIHQLYEHQQLWYWRYKSVIVSSPSSIYASNIFGFNVDYVFNANIYLCLVDSTPLFHGSNGTILSKGNVNSSPPRAAYMSQWTGSALVPIMVCRLFGAKSLSEPMTCYCHIDPREQRQWNVNKKTELLIHENISENIVCEMAAILSRRDKSKH